MIPPQPTPQSMPEMGIKERLFDWDDERKLTQLFMPPGYP